MTYTDLMVVLKHMIGEKVISGFKGSIDFYYWMGIPVARSWPKSPGKSRSDNVMAQWPIFTQATRLWAQTSQSVKDAYTEMAVSTPYRNVDLFVRGYINGRTKMYG